MCFWNWCYTLVTRVSHLINFLDAYTEVTPQRHVLSLLQPFVILSNITIDAAAPIPVITRNINLMLKQNGLLTLCIAFIWACNHKNLLNSLRTSPHILYVQLPRCFGNKLCLIFIGPYSEAPINVVWEAISVCLGILIRP